MTATAAPSVDARLSCRLGARPHDALQVSSTSVGPVHTVHLPVRGGPDAVVLVRDTAGLAAGDAFEARVVLEPDAAVVLSDAGPTSLLAGRDGRTGTEHLDLDVGAGAYAVVLPHAVVPFAGTRAVLRTTAQVHPTGTLLLGSVLAPGRAAAGELWRADLLEQTLELRVAGGLRVRDALRVGPRAPSPTGHLVSLFARGEGMRGRLAAAQAVMGEGFGASAPDDDLLVLRGLVTSSWEGYGALRRVVCALAPALAGWRWSSIGFPD